MLINTLKFHDTNIKSINVYTINNKENIIYTNSDNKIIFYNLYNNKIIKIICLPNTKIKYNNDFIYSINKNNIVKTDGSKYKTFSHIGSEISDIQFYNNNIYISIVLGFIYIFKNEKIINLITDKKPGLCCFYITNKYIYIGYYDGVITIFKNNKKYNRITKIKTLDLFYTYNPVLKIEEYNGFIYCSYSNGVVSILKNTKHITNINMLNKNILTSFSNSFLIFNNYSKNTSYIKNIDMQNIFKTNNNIENCIYNNGFLIYSNENIVYIYLLHLTKYSYNNCSENIKKYIYNIFKYCNTFLINDLFLVILNNILYLNALCN